jgi:hypothetical protein
MSKTEDQPGVVEQTIKDLLPVLNAGFDWERVKQFYDKHPEGTAITLQFKDKGGENTIEEITMVVNDGPEIAITDAVPEDYNWLGVIATYQDYGLKILDPEHPMGPDEARYTHRGVTIHPAEEESRERLWLVGSGVLESMLESVIWKQEQNQSNSQ